MPLDLEKARRETRASEELIHFNNAGAALMPAPVVDALLAFHQREERCGGYETEAAQAQSLQQLYPSTARLINCNTAELAYTESATRAWQIAFHAFALKRGDKIITTSAEYGSNMIAYLHRAQRDGLEIVVAPDDASGQVDVQALAALIDERVALISMTHIPTGGGLVNPAAAIGAVAKRAGIPFLLDACQSVGQLPIDVEHIGCDMLCMTGRKYLRGPRGTGMLYVRESLLDTLDPATLDQHGAVLTSPRDYRIQAGAKRFENWESNCAAKLALGTAIDYCLSWGMPAIAERVLHLGEYLRGRLAQIDGVHCTDLGEQRCGIVTFYTQQAQPQQIKSHLAAQQINVSVSRGSGSLLSFQPRGLSEVVRASVHYYNTEAEIDHCCEQLQKYLRAQPT